MKTIAIITFIASIALFSTNSFAQRKSAPSKTNKKLRLIIKPLPKTKIEIEDWKEHENRELKLTLQFPKSPTVTTNKYFDGEADVESTVLNAYVNRVYYSLEVRKYPDGFLPDRIDLGAAYGGWLRDYVLFDVKVINERVFDFGGYKTVEFVYQQTENDLLIHRALVVGQNLYQLILQLEIKDKNGFEETLLKNREKIDKFFNSFALTEEKITDRIIG